MMKKSLFAAALLLAFVRPAFALDRCESDFRRGIAEMKQLFLRLTPACQKEVDLGDSNEDKILKACSGSEISIALEMQGIENSRLTPLCQDAACDRLRASGVCVKDKPFTWYLKKLGM